MSFEAFSNRGVEIHTPLGQWPVTRDQLYRAAEAGELSRSEYIAVDQARRSFKELRENLPVEERERKLHVASAFVFEGRLGDPKLVFRDHNTKHAHAEDRVLDQVYDFMKSSHDSNKPLPRITALALVGMHGDEGSHDGTALHYDMLHAHNLPKGMPVPCYTCLRDIQRLVQEIENSRSSFDVNSQRGTNFPILIEHRNGQILRTDYKTLTMLPFPGSSEAGSFSEKRRARHLVQK